MVRSQLGVWTGVGLVVGNVVGVGVLTNTGYMAARLGPGAILLAWLVGGVMAMCGARCYAELARAIPRSGGEYRYLSDLLHPFWGTLAGWTSLLAGFAAPIALCAATAGPFFATLVPGAPPRLVGAVLIVLATASQAFDLRSAKGTQDALALVKGLLIAGFIAVGLALGAHATPHWRAPEATAGLPVRPFAVSLVYIAFAFSGWNAVVYVAEEFRDPPRMVPRAMLLGTALVTLVYLVINAIFVANLTGENLSGWLAQDTTRITLAHLLMEKLAGPGAARLTSLFVVLSLASSIISMTLAGPRVAAAMAAEGFLPRAFAGGAARPPVWSVLLQSGLALLLLATHSFEALLRSVGAILTLASALAVAALGRLRFGRTPFPRPSGGVMAAAFVYLAGSAWMLWFTLADDPRTLLWLAAVVGAAAIAYLTAARRHSAAGSATIRR
jgi:basic amino acid/polyamine antiporter, APA family